MKSFHPSESLSWRERARELVARLLRRSPTPALVVWAEMTPIDFSGEDTSLTQANLAALKSPRRATPWFYASSRRLG